MMKTWVVHRGWVYPLMPVAAIRGDGRPELLIGYGDKYVRQFNGRWHRVWSNRR